MADEQSSNKAHVHGLIFGLVGVIIFGLTLPFTRMAVAELDPFFVALGRALVAAGLADENYHAFPPVYPDDETPRSALRIWINYKGHNCDPDAEGVARATTSTVVTASVCILLSDYVITALWGV